MDGAVNTALARLQERSRIGLPAHMQLEAVRIAPGFVAMRLELQPFHLAPNGYLHAATVVALADTSCGFGCISNLPEGAVNFTTVELKTNFLRTATSGEIECEATLVHGGRRTQIWDATVYDARRRPMALFRCTQMLLYPDDRQNPDDRQSPDDRQNPDARQSPDVQQTGRHETQ